MSARYARTSNNLSEITRPHVLAQNDRSGRLHLPQAYIKPQRVTSELRSFDKGVSGGLKFYPEFPSSGCAFERKKVPIGRNRKTARLGYPSAKYVVRVSGSGGH
jgi:hypothetical protein